MRIERLEDADALRVAIAEDASRAERYAARFILVEGAWAWRDTLAALDAIAGERIHLSQLSDEDGVPSIGAVFAAIQQALASGAPAAMLLALSELLRLAPALAGPYVSRLARLAAGDRRRLYVPLLDVAGIIGPELDRQDQYVESSPPVWAVSGSGSSQVTVATRDYACLLGERYVGMRAYLEAWEDGGSDEMLLATSQADMLEGSMGTVSVTCLPTAHAVVTHCCHDAQSLGADLGSEAQWSWLAERLDQGDSLDAGCRRVLNARRYEPSVLWNTWRGSDPNLRWLGWLWARQHADGDDLVSSSLVASSSPREMIELLSIAPLRGPVSDLARLVDRRDALAKAGADLPTAFWSALAASSDPLAKLAALPGFTERERVEIVRALAEALGAGVAQERWQPLINLGYPELAAYVDPAETDEWSRRYARAYCVSRIADAPSPALAALIDEWPDVMDGYATVETRLQELSAEPDEIVWIDGLGLEWVGSMTSLLAKTGLGAQVSLARTSHPTVPPVQEQIASHRLDSLTTSVAGVDDDWAEALVGRIGVMQDIVDAVAGLLETRTRLVIASCHGMTRFASTGDRTPAPPGFDPDAGGRFARRVQAQAQAPDGPWRLIGENLVLLGHGQLYGATNVKGEQWGGASPEECLVPVIQLTRERMPLPRIIAWDEKIRLGPRGDANMEVELDGDCERLALHVGSQTATGEQKAPGQWRFALAGLSTGTVRGRLTCGRGAVGTITFTCSRGMVENDLGI